MTEEEIDLIEVGMTIYYHSLNSDNDTAIGVIDKLLPHDDIFVVSWTYTSGKYCGETYPKHTTTRRALSMDNYCHPIRQETI